MTKVLFILSFWRIKHVMGKIDKRATWIRNWVVDTVGGLCVIGCSLFWPQEEGRFYDQRPSLCRQIFHSSAFRICLQCNLAHHIEGICLYLSTADGEVTCSTPSSLARWACFVLLLVVNAVQNVTWRASIKWPNKGVLCLDFKQECSSNVCMATFITAIIYDSMLIQMGEVTVRTLRERSFRRYGWFSSLRGSHRLSCLLWRSTDSLWYTKQRHNLR